VTLDGSGSRDPNGDSLTYQWTQTGGAPVSLSSVTAARPTFTAPSAASTLTFRLNVGDGEFTSSDTVTITAAAEPAAGTPTYRSSSTTGNDAWSTAATLPVPAGATTGDVVVATVATWGNPAPAVTAPAGFTLKASYTAGDDTVRVYWKRLTAPDTGTYRFSWSGGRWSSAHALAVSGAATIGDPVEAINHAGGSGTTFANTTVSTLSTPLLAWIGRNDEPASGHTPPSGFTEVQDRDCSTVAYRQPASAGTQVASGGAYSGSAGPLHSVLVAIKGGTSTPPPTNRAPVAEAGPAQNVSTGSTVTLDGSGSTDPDGDPLTYAWAQTAGPAVTLSSASAVRPTFTAPATASTLTFALTVGDGQATATDSVTVTVTAPPPTNAPTYRSSSSTGNDAFASSANVPVPAGATTGDIVIAAVATWGGSAPAATAPAGFTLQATYTGANNGGADTVRVYWKRLTAPDTGTYAFTWSGGRWSSGHAIAVSGASASGNPIEAINRAGSTSSNAFPSTTVTTTAPPLLAWIGRNDEPTSQHTPPTGFTEVQDKDCTTLAVRSPGAPGTYTATGATYTGTASPLQAVLVAIR
jgi:hypothetical protein